MYLYTLILLALSCTSLPTLPPSSNDAHAPHFLRCPFALRLPLLPSTSSLALAPARSLRSARGRSNPRSPSQAIADVAHSQLAMYSMQHEQRPNVEVAATLLEGLCYSNKWVHFFPSLYVFPTRPPIEEAESRRRRVEWSPTLSPPSAAR